VRSGIDREREIRSSQGSVTAVLPFMANCKMLNVFPDFGICVAWLKEKGMFPRRWQGARLMSYHNSMPQTTQIWMPLLPIPFVGKFVHFRSAFPPPPQYLYIYNFTRKSVNNGSAILLFYLIVRDHELALRSVVPQSLCLPITLVAQINTENEILNGHNVPQHCIAIFVTQNQFGFGFFGFFW